VLAGFHAIPRFLWREESPRTQGETSWSKARNNNKRNPHYGTGGRRQTLPSVHKCHYISDKQVFWRRMSAV